MDKTDNPFLVTLRLPVKPSSILLICIKAVHFICFFLPWLTGLTAFIKIILSCLVLVSLYYYLSKHEFSKDKSRVAEIILTSEDIWQVKLKDGSLFQATLHHSLFVHPWLTIISLIYGNRRKYFIFTPETIDAEQFRRLRVRLRFQIGEQTH